MADIQFIRNKKYGTMGTGKNGWTKEVCNVSWNQKAPKLDIREWSPDYRKMSRGITLTKQEAKRLLAILATIDFEEFDTLGAHPESPMQVRPVYQPAAVPVAPTGSPVMQTSVPVATAAVVQSTPVSSVSPEIISMPEEFVEETATVEMADAEVEDPAELQSMAAPVCAV